MKSVRLYYRKTGKLRFVSHLDMNRFMIRLVRKAELPIWYTEGFNPHPYITFALPLSLGFESNYEVLEFKLTEDIPLDTLCDRMNSVAPKDICFFDAAEVCRKAGDVAFASYDIVFDDGGALLQELSVFLKREVIICKKKTKKGNINEFDIVPKIIKAEVSQKENNTHLEITLPAGSQDNVNPEILLSEFFENAAEQYYCYKIVRTAIMDKELKLFR